MLAGRPVGWLAGWLCLIGDVTGCWLLLHVISSSSPLLFSSFSVYYDFIDNKLCWRMKE
jgi:hypothetical protein